MSYKYIPNGTVTSPRGFLAGATSAGIKTEEEGYLDLGLLYSERPCAAAGVFTTNLIKAAPVILCQERLKRRKAQAIVVNSGCANACTGSRGLADAEEMAILGARKLNLAPEEVMVASTGVIGRNLPLDKISRGLARIKISREGGHELARAIMTTDTLPKEVAVEFEVKGGKAILGGIAKGAGMIHPNLATLLCFLTTDAQVEPEFLQEALKQAVDISFNMITVDGDTSPNDSVLLLANGLAGNKKISADSPEGLEFQTALNEVCTYLAKNIVRDGEGATKLIEVTVEGALSSGEARIVARTIASSPLVKAAIHGSDPNWGRIVAAAGRSGAKIEEANLDLYLGQLCLVRGGCPLNFDYEKARKILSREEISLRLCLNLGSGKATAWGCDLSEEYVTINSAYTT